MHCINRPARRIFATNKADGFSAVIPSKARPSSDGVIDITGGYGVNVPKYARLWAVGVGSDDDAFTLRVWGYNFVSGTSQNASGFYIPSLIASLGFVLGTTVGLAGTCVPATERIADTVTIVSEGTYTADVTRSGTVKLCSPANNLIGYAVVPIDGFDLLLFDTDDTTGTPTMNGLISLF